jgi:hypothetical protein
LDIYNHYYEKLYHPAITISYFFDPRYKGEYLPNETSSISYIIEETVKLADVTNIGKLTREIMEYHGKSGRFSLDFLWLKEATEDPITWWSSLEKDVPFLSQIAIKLMTIPASSAASERNWSDFGYIHNIKRNRLTNENVFKLVSIYSNLRLSSLYEKRLKNFFEREMEINDDENNDNGSEEGESEGEGEGEGVDDYYDYDYDDFDNIINLEDN